MKNTAALLDLLKWDVAEELKEAIHYSELTEETIVGSLDMSPMVLNQILNGERIPILRDIVSIANVINLDVKIELLGRR